jgi:hypothetical protein
LTLAPPRTTIRGPKMPKVHFINEARTTEVAPGRTIQDIAAELGIPVCREEFVGTGIGDKTVWVKGEEGALSPPDFWERRNGARGMKRFADKARVLGDVEVWTQAAIGDRLRSPRPVDAPPRPRFDPEAQRLGVSAAGTAAFPYGNPLAVGKGERDAIARNTGKPKKAGAAAAAEPEEDDEESDTE